MIENLLAGCQDTLPVIAPGLGDSLEQSRKAGAPVTIFRRKVRSADERLELGREPHRHRPASTTRGGLHVSHIDTIDIGTLLAIDFDGYKILVQDLGDLVILEGLALHHVAPVAG